MAQNETRRMWLSVSTPQVFEEYLIPIDGPLTGQDAINYERLLDLADMHRAPIEYNERRLG